jgi:hypothetical protein
MEVDHVLVAVDDLEAAAKEVEERFGLAGADVPISVTEGRPALLSLVLDKGVLEPSRRA